MLKTWNYLTINLETDMVLCHSPKFIFVHNPKTAGSSIVQKLVEAFSIEDIKFKIGGMKKHSTASTIKKHLPKEYNWKDYYKFGFVRNPFDACISSYFYWKKRIEQNDMIRSKAKYRAKKIAGMSIKEYINSYNVVQSRFFFNQSNKLLVDFIGKYENLQQDFDKIMTNINTSKNKKYILNHRNKNARKHYTYYFDDQDVKTFSEKFEKDLNIFNYRFGE